MGDLTNNFSKIEYTCKCGCNTYIDAQHVANEDQHLRNYISEQEGRDVRLIIHSGIRCNMHNKAVGGVDGSHHLPYQYEIKQGASDKHAHGMSNWKFRRYEKKAHKLGITKGGTGLYRWGAHNDCGRKRKWGGFWKT